MSRRPRGCRGHGYGEQVLERALLARDVAIEGLFSITWHHRSVCLKLAEAVSRDLFAAVGVAMTAAQLSPEQWSSFGRVLDWAEAIKLGIEERWDFPELGEIRALATDPAFMDMEAIALTVRPRGVLRHFEAILKAQEAALATQVCLDYLIDSAALLAKLDQIKATCPTCRDDIARCEASEAWN